MRSLRDVAWYLWCPKCHAIYFVEEAKEAIEPRAADTPPPEAKQEQSGWLFET
ncbi:MAG TPA: hypothetical protein VF278_00180 [Pirellulales bacterium]